MQTIGCGRELGQEGSEYSKPIIRTNFKDCECREGKVGQ